MENRKAGKSEISSDGKEISFRDGSGVIRWTRKCPTLDEWKFFLGGEADLENGFYFYSGDEIDGFIYAVFVPFKSLDFLIKFCSATGEIMQIHGAR